jgi:putative redox protein
MITVETKYLGDLRTEVRHVRSGKTLITDAPIDNHGKGEAFSPTDLLATSLGSCMLTMIGIAARIHNFNVGGTEARITKIMAENPRRVHEVIIEFNFPESSYSDNEKTIIENAALKCPVAKSLHPDLKQTVIFNYQ